MPNIKGFYSKLKTVLFLIKSLDLFKADALKQKQTMLKKAFCCNFQVTKHSIQIKDHLRSFDFEARKFIV